MAGKEFAARVNKLDNEADEAMWNVDNKNSGMASQAIPQATQV